MEEGSNDGKARKRGYTVILPLRNTDCLLKTGWMKIQAVFLCPNMNNST
jgi:hypothetical protein